MLSGGGLVGKVSHGNPYGDSIYPNDHWNLKTGYFEDPSPAIQVQTLRLEGPRSLG